MVGTCTLDYAIEWLRSMAVSVYSLPGCVVLENPPGLLSSEDHGTNTLTLWGIYRDLSAMGYKSIAHRVIHCASFGEPTARKRVIVIAGTDVNAMQVLLSRVRSTMFHSLWTVKYRLLAFAVHVKYRTSAHVEALFSTCTLNCLCRGGMVAVASAALSQHATAATRRPYQSQVHILWTRPFRSNPRNVPPRACSTQ